MWRVSAQLRTCQVPPNPEMLVSGDYVLWECIQHVLEVSKLARSANFGDFLDLGSERLRPHFDVPVVFVEYISWCERQFGEIERHPNMNEVS
jgi:hypothetical protein